VLLPLRAFLGVTFVYAGLSKLLDRHYLDAASPVGVRAQMLQAADGSPISALVTFAADHAVLAGLLIAFGEIAVGLGALLGLLTRLAAVGGVLLSLSFFLTVSWGTDPYYYGPDIGYAFAWVPLVLAGDGGVLSLSAWLRAGVRRRMDLPAAPPPREPVSVSNEVERRTVVRSGMIATAVGAVTVVAGSLVAFARRGSTAPVQAAAAQAAAPPSASASSTAPARAIGAPGTVIASLASIAVGTTQRVTTPAGGHVVLSRPTADTVTALDAACTHKGCPVDVVAGSGFRCPCHGATFGTDGSVSKGPAKTPLAPVPVRVDGGNVTLA
jgi:thiosulfate dehydrogenase (quinone) large subunit